MNAFAFKSKPRIKFFFQVLLVYAVAFSLEASFLFTASPQNFAEAKQVARQIFADCRSTFYCGCKFDKHGKINLRSCGYQIQKNKRRASRIEWEHIVPVSFWGQTLPCWKKAICCKKNVCYKGRACCRKVDSKFARMEADLHNIVPEIGELNGLRSNYRFGLLPHIEVGQFGSCEIKIDPVLRKVEPPPKTRGIIARAYLYMASKYQLPLSAAQQQLFSIWNSQYPPHQQELIWDERVAYVQGNHNPYISEYGKPLR